ncbi:MAG: hypothetical protein Q4C70_07345, partial [Planctomycetia bacterium]|nr:hypothetical protein [Planctomycetia bacterium]
FSVPSTFSTRSSSPEYTTEFKEKSKENTVKDSVRTVTIFIISVRSIFRMFFISAAEANIIFTVFIDFHYTPEYIIIIENDGKELY